MVGYVKCFLWSLYSQTAWILCKMFATAITSQIQLLQWVLFLTKWFWFLQHLGVCTELQHPAGWGFFPFPTDAQVVILQKICVLLLSFWNCLYMVVRSVIRWQQTNSLQETEFPPIVQITHQQELPFYFWSLSYCIKILVRGLMAKISKCPSLIKE